MQFDTQFVDAAKIGEVLISRPRVIRATRSLIFMTTELTAGERCVAMASGVFKVMKVTVIASEREAIQSQAAGLLRRSQ